MPNHKLQQQQKENTHQANYIKKATEAENPYERLYNNPLRFSVIDGTTPPFIPFTPQNMMFLQRTIGNQVVGRFIQAKLKIGHPGDRYEQEADRVAEEVMRMPEPKTQRQAEKEEELEEEKVIQQKPLSEQITSLVQRRVAPEEEEKEEEEILRTKEAHGQTPEVTTDLESRIQLLKGGGQPLPKSVQNFFEPIFGRDFSQVRIHTGTQAAYLARTMNARAFTVGQNIAFRAGQYSPGTTEGINLLAHELTHVVQQKGNRNSPRLVSFHQFRGTFLQNHLPIQMMEREALQFKRKDEEEVFDLVNKKRGENLKWSNKLYASAQKHSKWMHKSKKLVHTRRLIVKGYDLVGENIGTGFNKNSEVVEDWWNSQPHKANIERPQFEEGAVGIIGKGVNRYATQHFGAVDPKAEFWKESSKKKGEEWTHIIKGKVTDNIDSADKLLINIENVKGDFRSLPKKVIPDSSGSVTITIVTIGTDPAAVRIVTTDSHSNFTKVKVSL